MSADQNPAQSRSNLTLGAFRRWTEEERDDCPIRVVVYMADGSTVDGIATYASGTEHGVGAVNVVLDQARGPYA